MYAKKCMCKTGKNLVCKLNVYITIKNIKYCYIHFKKMYINHIITIQKIYRSYICRKKLKSLFYNLPDELKNIVVKYLKEDYYNKRFNKSISKILHNRFNILFGNQMDPFFRNIALPNGVLHLEYYRSIINILNLYTKYIDIIDIEYNNNLLTISNCVWYDFIYPLSGGNIIYFDNGNIIDQESEIYKNLYDSLKNALYKYSNIYTFKYSLINQLKINN